MKNIRAITLTIYAAVYAIGVVWCLQMQASDSYAASKPPEAVDTPSGKAVSASMVRTFIFDGRVRISGTRVACRAFRYSLDELSSKLAQKK